MYSPEESKGKGGVRCKKARGSRIRKLTLTYRGEMDRDFFNFVEQGEPQGKLFKILFQQTFRDCISPIEVIGKKVKFMQIRWYDLRTSYRLSFLHHVRI